MIGVAVIGYGYWGPNLARSFADVRRLPARGGRRPASAALARAGERHPDRATCDRLARRPHRSRRRRGGRRDAGATHYEIALAALRAGRHVLVEKPMTATAEEARSWSTRQRSAGLI